MRNLLSTVLLSVMIMVVSCNQQDEILEQVNQSGLIINEQNKAVVNKLIELGYDLSAIKELDNFFLVEDDLLFLQGHK
ncbi:MAG: hypothetical protein U5K54_19640 [Cytophagales bacterium]|nr:hypothetical protein [Cytophagales bacterium]